MFNQCSAFNSNVTIENGANIGDFSSMFNQCQTFNKPFEIPSTATNVSSMFAYCYQFNQELTIPGTVSTCSNILQNCYNFNSPVTISEGVTIVSSMLQYCNGFEHDLEIPSTVTNAQSLPIANLEMSGTLILKNPSTVYTWSNSFDISMKKMKTLKVHPDLVESYKTTSGWSTYAFKIEAF